MQEFVDEIDDPSPPNMSFAEEYEAFAQTQPRDYPCDDCEIAFLTKKSLHMHKYRYHANPEKRTCYKLMKIEQKMENLHANY